MPDTSDKYEPRDEVSPEAMDNLVNTLRDAGRKEREKPLETEEDLGTARRCSDDPSRLVLSLRQTVG